MTPGPPKLPKRSNIFFMRKYAAAAAAQAAAEAPVSLDEVQQGLSARPPDGGNDSEGGRLIPLRLQRPHLLVPIFLGQQA